MSNIRDLVLDIAKRAKMASKLMANASTEKKKQGPYVARRYA